MSVTILHTIALKDLPLSSRISGKPIIRLNKKNNAITFNKAARVILNIDKGGEVLFHIIKCQEIKCLAIEVLKSSKVKDGFRVSKVGDIKRKGLVGILLERLNMTDPKLESVSFKLIPDPVQAYQDLKVFKVIPV